MELMLQMIIKLNPAFNLDLRINFGSIIIIPVNDREIEPAFNQNPVLLKSMLDMLLKLFPKSFLELIVRN